VSGPCEPVVQQDGYDKGLRLVCEGHGTAEPVMGEDGHGQAYDVTLAQMTRLVEAHRAAVAPCEPAVVAVPGGLALNCAGHGTLDPVARPATRESVLRAFDGHREAW
jgi:hypothetical protein